MKLAFKTISALLIGASGTQVFAQTSLSLQEAISLGLKKSENIQQASVDIEKAEEQINEAWASLFPQISANIQTIRHTKSPVIQIGEMASPIKQDWELVSTIQVQQIIFAFGRVSHALDLAKSSRRAQSIARKAVEREIRYAVEVAYYNVLSAQKVLDIAKDSLKNAKKNQQALYKRFQGGRVPRFDNIKMSSDVASRLPVVSDAEKNLRLAYLQLNLLLELDVEKRPTLTTNMGTRFSELDRGELLQAIYSNPILEVNKISVDIADKQAKLARAEHFPTISAFGAYNRSGTGDSMPPDDDYLFDSTSIGLQVNIPIFQGGAVSSRHKQAVLEKTRAQIEEKKQRERLIVELESSIAQYSTNVEKYKSATTASKLAQEAYNLTRARYETGGATRNDLNDSERALTNARIQLQTALFQIYKNKADIDRFTQKVVAK